MASDALDVPVEQRPARLRWRHHRHATRALPIPTGERITPTPGYEVKLASEAEGILAWAIEGCLWWLDEDNGGDIPMSAEMIELQTLHLEGNDEFAELISGGWLVSTRRGRRHERRSVERLRTTCRPTRRVARRPRRLS